MALLGHLVNADNQDRKVKLDLWANKAYQGQEDNQDLRANGDHLVRQACLAKMADLVQKESVDRLDQLVKLGNKDLLAHLEHKVYPVLLGLGETEDHPVHQAHKAQWDQLDLLEVLVQEDLQVSPAIQV